MQTQNLAWDARARMMNSTLDSEQEFDSFSALVSDAANFVDDLASDDAVNVFPVASKGER